ncbi:MAG: cell division protein FtsQ/DivIB [Gemmatimonadales bacterium]
MKRRFAISILSLVVVVAVVVGGPFGLSKIGFFQIRQVELVGVRYLSPQRLLERSGLAADQNLFSSLEVVDRNLAAMPGVVDVRLKRRLPGTLRILVEERVPVAFAPTESGLQPLDASARPLPYDPVNADLDLPIVPDADSFVIGVLATIRTADFSLYSDIDAALRGRDRDVILELGSQELMLRGYPTSSEITAIDVVRRELSETGREFHQIDVRFSGRVIVRRGGE